MKEKIIFVIVTYKPNKKALEGLKRELGSWQVIVIDNTSDNRGYSGGANIGMEKAIKAGAQWIVVMNDDMSLTKDAIKKFTDILKKSPVAIVGPFAGALDTVRWSTIYPSRTVDYISGSIMAIHRKVIETVGYFYKPYFIYYEEVELCLQAKRAGFPLIYAPLPGIHHKESATMGQGSFYQEYYAARNHLLFVERNAPTSVKLHALLRMPKTLYEHYQNGNVGALTGVRDFALRRFGQYGRKV